MPDDQPAPTGEFLLYQTEDGRSRIECRLRDKTLWLSLNQISELFDREKSVISKHLKNIFEEGELVRDSVVAQNATTAADGKTYKVDYYRLEAVLANCWKAGPGPDAPPVSGWIIGMWSSSAAFAFMAHESRLLLFSLDRSKQGLEFQKWTG
jgi:hypothetical protein